MSSATGRTVPPSPERRPTAPHAAAATGRRAIWTRSPSGRIPFGAPHPQMDGEVDGEDQNRPDDGARRRIAVAVELKAELVHVDIGHQGGVAGTAAGHGEDQVEALDRGDDGA